MGIRSYRLHPPSASYVTALTNGLLVQKDTSFSHSVFVAFDVDIHLFFCVYDKLLTLSTYPSTCYPDASLYYTTPFHIRLPPTLSF